VSERDKKAAEEAEAVRKAAEEEALKRAEELEKAGDTAAAESVVEAASELPDTVPKAEMARGAFGSSVGSKTTWHAEVVDVKEFLKAIIDGKIPEDYITIVQSKLNALAVSKKVEKTNLGIRIYKKVSANAR
jgi:hypothetical protein